MKKLINEPFLFTGLGLINRTKKVKVFKIYNEDRQLFQYVLKANSCWMSHDRMHNLMRFDEPIPVNNLSIDAGRRWDITIIKGDTESVRFSYY